MHRLQLGLFTHVAFMRGSMQRLAVPRTATGEVTGNPVVEMQATLAQIVQHCTELGMVGPAAHAERLRQHLDVPGATPHYLAQGMEELELRISDEMASRQ